MLKTPFTLAEKKQLTHDVYELTYACQALSQEYPIPGQYVMFQLAPGLNRAYSIASFSHISEDPRFTLIIKRIPDGRGSPLICDAEVGSVFSGMLPLGHFTLRDTPRSKCFIGTGTGFAPLYCQLLASSLSPSRPARVLFNFGVRNFTDSLYTEEIEKIGESFEEFRYIQYFSREDSISSSSNELGRVSLHGYVTDWITRENMALYEEYYICGSPAMVKSAREKLEALGITKENIYWEQF